MAYYLGAGMHDSCLGARGGVMHGRVEESEITGQLSVGAFCMGVVFVSFLGKESWGQGVNVPDL